MPTLCDTFKILSFQTWEKIKSGRHVNFQLKEETIADIIILNLKLNHSEQVKTKVFTKSEEGVNGSDWEWWFHGINGKWIGFRVQAKIINIHSDEFEHLHYRNSRSQLYQCDKLIENAINVQAPKIPIYCFYSQTNNDGYFKNWRCQTFPYYKNFYGCSLASAFEIKKLRETNSKHIIDLQDKIEPWHCLVCCKGFGHGDFISNIAEYATSNFLQESEDFSNLDINIPKNFITEKPPDYVINILESENSDNIKSPDKELQGVIIIKEK